MAKAKSRMRGAFSGAAAGAGAGAAFGPWGAGIGAGIGGLGGALGLFDEEEASQQPLETPEQKAARQKLLDFALTGQYGDFTAGEDIPLGYGDYGMTELEGSGQSALKTLMRSIPDQYRLGDEALRGFLATDPGMIEAQFNPFKAQTERRIRESADALKRNASFAGNLYSSDTIRQLGDLEARGTETLTGELARLTNESMNRRLSAIPLAYQSAESQEANAMGRVGASQAYGSLTRMLNDRRIKERDAELLRRREELKLPITAATAVAGSSAEFGVPSVTSSPYQDLMNMVGQVGGQYLGDMAADRRFDRRNAESQIAESKRLQRLYLS